MADDTQLYINNWSTTISDATVAVDATTINVSSSTSATLGAISANEYFVATLSDGANLEVVWITANNESGALTVLRAQEGTAGLSYTTGDTIEIRNTKGTYQNFVQRDAAETLTQKTLTSPVLNTGVSGTAILNDDSMATASETTVPTSESVKAYVDSATPASHKATHITSGSDEIDGDKLDIDWNPTYSTPATSTEMDSVDNLSSHLKGIDTELNAKSTTAHKATHITSGSDEVDGDKLDIDWNPTYSTPATSPSQADSVDNLTAHLYGIDQALSSAGGGGLTWQLMATNATASAENGYLINASGGNITITLPTSPSEGDPVGICDAYNKATTNTITIGRNGENIAGVADDLVVDIDGAGFSLVYVDSTRGWEVADDVGFGSAIGNLVEDTTPQLGGMLDVNGNAIGDGTLELLKFSETASAVNEITVKNAATGNNPAFMATGEADTGINFENDQAEEILILDAIASAVNEVTIKNAATGNNPIIAATGEADTGLNFENSEGEEIVILDAVATAVNEITIANAVASSGPEIKATGGDSNIDIEMIPKGTGAVNLLDSVLLRPIIKDYAERKQATASTASTILNVVDGNVISFTLTEATTVSTSGILADEAGSLTMYATAATGSEYAITWPGTWKWLGSATPSTFATGTEHCVQLSWLDGDDTAKFYATYVGAYGTV